MDSYAFKLYATIFCAFYAPTVPAAAYKFEFRKQPKDQISIEGTSATFRCSAVSVPAKPIVYLWKRNGKYIEIVNKKRSKTRFGGDLVITSPTEDDFGNDYQCVAQCADGAIVSRSAKLQKAQLSIYESPNRTSIERREGTYLLLKPPRLTSTPPAAFRWELCNSQHQCKDPDPARSFVTSEGNLLISPILQTNETGYIPRVFTGVEYFNEGYLIYGSITVTDRLKDGAGRKSCPDSKVMHLPTKNNFTVFEGQNVSLDCLAVLKRCRIILSIMWRDKNMALRSTSRRLLLINVTKQDEGEYRCIPHNLASYKASYHVYVIEKPRVMKEPHTVLVLGNDAIVPGGAASNADSIDWYTNADRIPPNSGHFRITANGSLVIRQRSSSFAGIYQIIYRNKAGMVSRTVRVDIPKGIHGDKITSTSGEIDFLRPNLQNGVVYYRWLIQTSSTAKLKLYFTDLLPIGPCGETFVRLDRGLSNKHQFCDTSKPQGILEIEGPYIVVSVYGNGTQLAKQGFKLLYGYDVTVPTTSVATTTRSQSSISTQQKITAATTAKHFRTSTDHTSKLNTLSLTTKKARKPKCKTTKGTGSRPVDSTTTATGTAKVTVSPPKKRDNINKKGFKATLFAGVGCSLAVIIIIAAGVFCYRRRNPKADFKLPASKEMALSGAGSSANNGSSRTDRSSSARETCFIVQGNQDQPSNIARYSDIMPDIIPSNEPNHYELGYIGPCNNPPTDEHYAPLNRGATSPYQETYTALQFDDVNKRQHRPEVHPYAVVVPEEKNNHYMRAHSTGSKDVKPLAPCPIYAEYERVGLKDDENRRLGQQIANLRQNQQSPSEYQDPMPTVPIKRCVSESRLPLAARNIQNDAASQPFYHVLENDSATDTKSGHSYCYEGISQHNHNRQQKACSRQDQLSPPEYHHPMPTVPIKRCVSDSRLSTAARDIPSEDASQPFYHVLECSSPNDTKGSNSSYYEGLSPNKDDSQEGCSPQLFYHVLEDIVPNRSKTDTPDYKNVGDKGQTMELYLEPCPIPPKTHKKPRMQQQQQKQGIGIKESPAEYHTAHYIQPNPVKPSTVTVKMSPQMQIKGSQAKVSHGPVYMPPRNENADRPITNKADDLPL